MKTKVEKQYRYECKGCGRLLAKGKIKGKLEIVCPRCKTYNNFEKKKSVK